MDKQPQDHFRDATEMVSEQGKFEAWFLDVPEPNPEFLAKFLDGMYASQDTDAMWCSWQAAKEQAAQELIDMHNFDSRHIDILHVEIARVRAEKNKRIAELERELAEAKVYAKACHGIPASELDGISIGDYICKKAFLNGMEIANGTAGFELSGSACELLAYSFAGQFSGSGAKNYLEFRLNHPEIGNFTVTMQRQEGKTPVQVLAELREDLAEMQSIARAHQDGRLSALEELAVLRPELSDKERRGIDLEDEVQAQKKVNKLMAEAIDELNADLAEIKHAGYAPDGHWIAPNEATPSMLAYIITVDRHGGYRCMRDAYLKEKSK